ncbi:hypothetical protein BaRGS_00016058 [Batillaria attramentaria]|uniref:Uncharacterized protein n=1 Tax=Batillaria attramentaria TaxID=370345 RepID=A0ABD0L0L1_9CAEN
MKVKGETRGKGGKDILHKKIALHKFVKSTAEIYLEYGPVHETAAKNVHFRQNVSPRPHEKNTLQRAPYKRSFAYSVAKQMAELRRGVVKPRERTNAPRGKKEKKKGGNP